MTAYVANVSITLNTAQVLSAGVAGVQGSPGAVQSISVAGTTNEIAVTGSTLNAGNPSGTFTIALAPNVVIPKPSSGIALSVTGTSSANAISVSPAANTLGVSVLGASSDAARLALTDGNTGTRSWQLRVGAIGSGGFDIFDATRIASTLQISSTGNTFVLAPSSGVALTVSGLAGVFGAQINQATTTGGCLKLSNSSDSGVQLLVGGATNGIRFGTSSSGSLIEGVDNTGVGSFQPLFVDGLTFQVGTGSSPVARLNINSTGTVTVDAPTSGVALVVNGLTSSSTIGIDATTYGWTTKGAVDIGGWGAVMADSGSVNVVGNLYYSTSVGGWTYKTTDQGSFIRQDNAGNIYLATTPQGTAGTVATMTNRLTVANAGNVTIAAPTSGTALAVTAQGTNQGLVVNSTSNTTNGSVQLGFDGNGNCYLYNTVAAMVIGSTVAAACNLVTNNSTRLAVNSAGNVVINPPSSGTSLDVTSVAGGPAITFGASGAYSSAAVNRGVLYYDTTGGTLTLAARSSGGSTSINLTTSNSGTDTTRFTINSTGNATVNAPSSGTALTVNAVTTSNALALNATGNTTNGQLLFNFDSSGNAYVYNDILNTAFFIGGSNGSSTSDAIKMVTANATRVNIASAGNVSVNAPSSGVALAVTGASSAFATTINGANSSNGPALSLVGNYTGSGNTDLLQISDVNNTNGANIQITGNGSTNPNKYIRVVNGVFEIVNSAYTAQLLDLTDAGNLTVTSTGATPQFQFNTSGVGAQMVLAAASTYASTFVVMGNGNTAANGVLIQQDASSTGYIRNQASGTLYLGTGSTNWVGISSAGNVTVSAPTSGTALTVTSVAGAVAINAIQAASSANYALQVTGASTTGSSLGLIVKAGTNTSDFALAVQNQASGNMFVVNGNGNATLSAPTSGTAFTVNGVATSQAATINGSSSSGQSFGLYIAAGTTSSDSALNITNQANTHQLVKVNGDGSTVWGFNGTGNTITTAAAGNVTIAAPSSGVGLTVNAVSGTHSTQIGDSANNKFNAGFLESPINTQNAAYTCVLSDSAKTIYHSDGTARTYTLPANSSVAYPIGTKIKFINDASAAVNVTISITTDTMVLAGTGSTGSRTLAQYGIAEAQKVGSTRWYISGTGLT